MAPKISTKVSWGVENGVLLGHGETALLLGKMAVLTAGWVRIT